MIYVASSWRNTRQPEVVSRLRAAGNEVYDFRDPDGSEPFHWSEVMPSYRRVGPGSPEQLADVTEYVLALRHPITEAGFNSDFGAMQRSQTCVLVLPCGRSAHLELGWFVGEGRRTAILLGGPSVVPELMYKMVDKLTDSLDDLIPWASVNTLTTLLDACRNVMSDKSITSRHDGMSAATILQEIHNKFGRNAFAYCSPLDVATVMREFYG